MPQDENATPLEGGEGGSEDVEDSGEDGESDYEGGGGGEDDDPEEDSGMPPAQLDRRGATPQDENAAPLEGGGRRWQGRRRPWRG